MGAPWVQQGPSSRVCLLGTGVTSRDSCPAAWAQPWAAAPPQLRPCTALLPFTLFSGAQFLLLLALVSHGAAPRS